MSEHGYSSHESQCSIFHTWQVEDELSKLKCLSSESSNELTNMLGSRVEHAMDMAKKLLRVAKVQGAQL